MKEAIKRIYKRFLPGYEEFLLCELKGMQSVLDLGCGKNSPLKILKEECYKVGVDIFKRDLAISQSKQIHNKYYLIDVLKINRKFKPKSFDCVIALDLIEHLTRRQGLKLIRKMEQIAKKKVIIFTPNGFYHQKDNINPFQKHKSGWKVLDFQKLGYNVFGVNGLKYLRKEQSRLKFQPYYFWLILSDLTQLLTKHQSELAFQLLSVKKLPINQQLF